jgi:hypothetical protein
MIGFVKFYLEKFASVTDQFGKEIRNRSDDITESADMVSGDTDIRIFIEHNRSENNGLVKEKFQGYDDIQEVGTNKRASRKVDLSVPKKNNQASFAPGINIQENYMGASDVPRRI